MQSLTRYISCLFSTLLNGNIVDVVKPDGICSLTFVVTKCPWLFLHPSVFAIKHWRSTGITNGVLSDFCID